MKKLFAIARVASVLFFGGIALFLVIASIVKLRFDLFVEAILYCVLGLMAISGINERQALYEKDGISNLTK